jgi:hypothetical protein
MEAVFRCNDCGRGTVRPLASEIARRQCVACQERQARVVRFLEGRGARRSVAAMTAAPRRTGIVLAT